ncbi:MAG: hypothetical protein LIO93_06470, partial [Bacteroidales bacterium]|nr:hypothetical protein [Bacteroidales bacterium]
LYKVKIGVALWLVELADSLNEDKIEEHAFEILQESLALSKKKIDISFNNGLSGIGFSLFYLIKNQLLDADFNELFEQQTHTVLKQIKILSDLNPYE